MEVSKPKVGKLIRKLIKRKKDGRKKKNKVIKKKKKVKKDEDGKIVALENNKITAGRLKANRIQEGMYLKGIRTLYVGRGKLNEANEARKNEDINRIIDIGKVCADEEPNPQPQCAASSVADREKSKTDSDFSFSPISFKVNSESDSKKMSPDSREIIICKDEGENRSEHWSKKIQEQYSEEFKKFALQLEVEVSNEILSKLPKHGALQKALKFLANPNENEESSTPQGSPNGFLFLNPVEHKMREKQKKNTSLFSFEPSNIQNPSFSQDISFLPHFLQQDTSSPSQKSNENLEDFDVEVNVDSPQLQFYRRNMF